MGFTIKNTDYDQELSVNNGSKCKSNDVTKNKEYVLVGLIQTVIVYLHQTYSP